MLSFGCNYNKLKTNLRLAICSLKLLEKKKTELAQMRRKEISAYLATDKIQLAKMRVEHLIREDRLIDAMAIVEMYCLQLLSRFGLIRQKCYSIDEAVSSLLWVAPHLKTDVVELKAIAKQLAVKYGKRYVFAARNNSSCFVNEELIHKLDAQAFPKTLIEKYLLEIARSNGVVYKPDEKILAGEKQDGAISNVSLIDLDDTKPQGRGFFPNLPSNEESLLSELLSVPYPELPSVLNTSLSDVGETGIDNNEVDFDDIVKRFKALKKR